MNQHINLSRTVNEPFEIEIRLASSADTGRIDEINRQSWGGGITTHELLEARHGAINGRDWTTHISESVAAHLKQADVTTFVAEHDSQVVGFAAGQIKSEGPSDIGVVSYNAVDPAFRGHGVGTALIKHVMAYLKTKGARALTVVTLEEDQAACRIYERLGFQRLTRLVYFSKDC